MYKSLANLGFKSNIIHYLPSCHSTNDVALQFSAQHVPEGSIVITDNQSAGKGQRDNFWESTPSMNLTFSLILTPSFLLIKKQFFLKKTICIALATVIQAQVKEKVKVKWPNDIYVGEKKIAGILIQNKIKGSFLKQAIIGIGINVNQTNFTTPKAVSLKNLTQHTFTLSKVLSEVIISISDNYNILKKEKYKEIDKKYNALLYRIKEKMLFISKEEFEGEITGVDTIGRLLVETNTGTKCFQHKEVKFSL